MFSSEEGTEAQRDQVTRLGSHGMPEAKLGLQPLLQALGCNALCHVFSVGLGTFDVG